MGKVNQDIFRAYDIRGIYGKDIDEELALDIGKGFGETIGKGKTVLVGRDIRTSSPSLCESLIKGIRSQGVDVLYAGVIPTPLLYFAISHYKLDGGITVSASHNPAQWNGFKICKKDAYVMGLGSGLEKIMYKVLEGKFKSEKDGTITDRSDEIMKEYLDTLAGSVGSLKGLKVGIDPGNGAYSKHASDLFARKGAQVYAIGDVPDGTFPSRSPEPNPSTIAELVDLVKSKGLGLGIAFDGDGDRVLFVTDAGEVIGGDIALALLVKEYLKKGEKVAYEPSCSSCVEDETIKAGGVLLLTRVGHSFFKEKMKKENARFGGEISGHMYFKETYGADDGLFAALKIAELISRKKSGFSALIEELPRYVKIYEEIDADDKRKFETIRMITKDLSRMGYRIIDLDGVKAITDDGWILIRASNTGPKIKITAEAKNAKRTEELIAIGKSEFAANYPKSDA